MAVLQLTFTNVPADILLTIEPEDIEYGHDIGILTPTRPFARGSHPWSSVIDDYTPVEVPEPRVPTWASRTTSRSAQDHHDQQYKKLMDDIDFLILQSSQENDSHEEILDELDALWEADLDGSIFDPSEPFGHKACRREILPSTATEVVRVTAIKAGYYIGSIGGLTPNVYIKTRMPLDPHSIYLMDITATPLERFPWRATKVYPKLSTADMLVSCVFIQESSGHPAGFPGNRDETSSRQYLLPTPPSHIGTMVGRKGKNIASLIESVNGWDSSESFGEPDITITPTNDFAGCIVTFHEPPECFWKISDIEWLISHFHC